MTLFLHSMNCSDPSEKIVTSVGGSWAHHFLNKSAAIFLKRPLVWSLLQPRVYFGLTRVFLGTSDKKVFSICTLVRGLWWFPAPLPFRISGVSLRLAKGCSASMICRCAASLILASFSSMSTEGRIAHAHLLHKKRPLQ